MRKTRRKLEEMLWVTGLHNFARAVYGRTAGREVAAARAKIRSFYAQLIPQPSLVFDIGANVGAMSAIFAALGNRVIALEPNGDCARHIQLSYADYGIDVIQAVAGAEDGLATIRLSDERDDISSLSVEWMEAIKNEHPNYSELWSKQATVPMLKLDTLVTHYGAPEFIKIDVEGYEESVLAGLSLQPPLLSFEFNAAFLPATERCLDSKVFAADSEFNYALGDPSTFEHPWMGKDQIKKLLGSMDKQDRHGDIFVRRPRLQA